MHGAETAARDSMYHACFKSLCSLYLVDRVVLVGNIQTTGTHREGDWGRNALTVNITIWT